MLFVKICPESDALRTVEKPRSALAGCFDGGFGQRVDRCRTGGRLRFGMGPERRTDQRPPQEQRGDEQLTRSLTDPLPETGDQPVEGRSAPGRSGVDELAGPGDDGFEPRHQWVGAVAAPGDGQIGRRRPVQRADAQHVRRRQAVEARASPPHQLVELRPCRLPRRHEALDVHGGTVAGVEYEDRLTIATPEGVDLDLVVAGLGSRFMAYVVDLALQLLAILALTFGTAALGEAGPAIFAVGAFIVFFGYHVAFETLASGRTPGKMLTHLRVVRDDGTPEGFVASVVRNVVRLIDLLPAAYTVGVIAVLATERHQRLGDLAAGTIVVRDARSFSAEGVRSVAGPPGDGPPARSGGMGSLGRHRR